MPTICDAEICATCSARGREALGLFDHAARVRRRARRGLRRPHRAERDAVHSLPRRQSHAPEEWAETDAIAAGAADLSRRSPAGRIVTPIRSIWSSIRCDVFSEPRDVEAAVKGGSVFAAGGGGWADHGRMLGTAAVNAGRPELVSMDEVPDDAWIATAAAIGAPAGNDGMGDARRRLREGGAAGAEGAGRADLRPHHRPERQVQHAQCAGCRRPFSAPRWSTRSATSARIRPATWARSVSPTRREQMIQSAVGGNRSQNAYIELVVRGATAKISPILRTAADMSGGFIASCRNPVRASYVKKHAALGGISIALALGEAILNAEPKGGKRRDRRHLPGRPRARSSAAARSRGRPCNIRREAFDIGTVTIGDGAKARHPARDERIHGGRRRATARASPAFPDVITTLDPRRRPGQRRRAA